MMDNTALVFPGQGSQYIGMCKDLNSCCYFNEYFNKASDLFKVDLLSYCINGPNKELSSTYIAQPAIFIHSIIIDQILKANNFNVKAVSGHSLGEYSALVSSKVISFDECLKILKVRCSEMQKANNTYKGGMLAIISEDLPLIQKICSNFSKTVIANINSANQIIVSGPNNEIKQAIQLFKYNGIKKVIKLNVSGAFHSPLMKGANVSLKKAINSVNFNNTDIPIYQNRLPIENFKGKDIKYNLLNQLTGSVKWYQTILNMKNNGINKIIEIGPGRVLSKLIQKIDSNIETISIGNIEDLENNEFKFKK